MERLSIGIVGCGMLARSNYMKSLPRIDGIRVVAVHDRQDAAAAAAADMFGAEALDFNLLCARVKAVIVATPPSTHYPIVKDCLAHGLTVVCEKPFVASTSEACELVALADAARVGLYVGHLRRTFPAALLARDLIVGGSLGAVQRIKMAEGGRFSWEAASGYVTHDPAGGVLFDTGSHTVDLALFAAGIDDAIAGVEVDRIHRDRAEPSHEIEAHGRLKVEGRSVPFQLRLSRFQALANRVRIVLDHGVVDLSVGPRDRIRVTGPSGSAVVPTTQVASDFNEHFVDQWADIFGPGGGERFRAKHFVGLTAVLEAVAAAKEAA